MLTVWCVLNGSKYRDEEALILRDQVSRNLAIPHDFWCLSDRRISGIDCLVDRAGWPGWWSKLALFRYACEGRHLYLDLDCVVTGNLEPLLSDQLCMPANWGQSGHGGCQSSVMAWGRDYSAIAEAFDVTQLHKADNGNCGSYGPRRLWGDQEFITALYGDPGKGEVKAMTGIYSYKYHAIHGLPHDAIAVAFHGEPKPGQVNDAWVKASRSFTATRP